MPSPKKAALVDRLTTELASAGSVVLSDFSGTNVEEISQLRSRCRAAGVTFRVVKNTLVGRAVEGTDKEGLTAHFAGPTAVAFSDDMVAPARVLKEFSKEYGKLEFKAGYVDGQIIDSAGVHALADLPSREVLLSQVVGTLQAPIASLARTLNATISGLVNALDQIAKQKDAAA
ncbi:MAG: 50S ribosomal protein L10 [Candidatus Latescibacteria bacterium]|nr:50S ribosomal protein L10 [bacterium]MCB9512930.1 50S ribosomal protein L10 [Candidatus Latescibacterota bacterium]MCB9516409.1 50S ribosomal protein L10 [Candidatus Latescibacterota bacterium]